MVVYDGGSDVEIPGYTRYLELIGRSISLIPGLYEHQAMLVSGATVSQMQVRALAKWTTKERLDESTIESEIGFA
jgi:hypothetical protein